MFAKAAQRAVQRVTQESYRTNRIRIKQKYPDGWQPPKRISREAMEGIRELHNFDPVKFTTPALAEEFKISPEAVSRILKSSWVPSDAQRKRLLQRDETNHASAKLASAKQETKAMEGLNLRPLPGSKHAPLVQPPKHVPSASKLSLKEARQRDGSQPTYTRGFRDANGRPEQRRTSPDTHRPNARRHEPNAHRPRDTQWDMDYGEQGLAFSPRGVDARDKLSFE